MKCRSVYAAIDYSQEVKAFQLPWVAPVPPQGPSEEEVARRAASKERAGQRLRDKRHGIPVLPCSKERAWHTLVSWQLPWVAPVAPQGPSEEEVARRAANKERAGQRLRDMAAAKRAAKRAAELEEVEGEVEGLRAVIEDVEDGAEGREAIMLLSRVRCATLSEARAKLAKSMATLRKLRGEEGEGEGEEGEGEGEERETGSVAGGAEEQDESVLYPLLDIPDADLTAEELREKRRQRTMRGIALGQARMRQAAEEKRAKAAAERDEEERKRRENPEAYAAELKARFQQVQAALEQRKRRKLGAGGVVLGAAAASPSVGGEESGGKGMGSEGGASGGEAVGGGGAAGAATGAAGGAAGATAASAAGAGGGVSGGGVSGSAVSSVLSLAAAAAAAASGQAVKGAKLDITPLGGPAGGLAGGTGVGLGGGLAGSVAGGRTERITAAHRERMKLLTAAAFESDFGMFDEDWLVYKRMSAKGVEEEEEEEAEREAAELEKLRARLQEVDPAFLVSINAAPASTTAPGTATSVPGPSVRQPTDADYQIRLGVERVRAAEIIFEPSLIGLDRAGLGESLGAAVRRTAEELRSRLVPLYSRTKSASGAFAVATAVSGMENVPPSFLFLTGGSSLLPGMRGRLEAEYRQVLPMGSGIKIVEARDVFWDAWRGAAAMAGDGRRLLRQAVSRKEYEERGPDAFRRYKFEYF
ncbi:unnamed protein product [Closterium sp. NIES-65]|nr:unnamed protein product [Closterium sp. NIES-65]